MDRQTLVNYGWIVIAALVIAIMLALATPFGKYVMDGVSSVASGYINASNNAMSDANRQELVDEWTDKWANSANTNKGYDHNTPELHPTGIDLDGNGRVEPKTKDVYIYGNYEYRYNQSYSILLSNKSWSTISNQNGWGVLCINKVEDPGPILESINGKPVVSLAYTFNENDLLTKPPEIPLSVTNMYATFYNCSSLVYAPSIHENVTKMGRTFYGCESLLVAPKIPNSVTDLAFTFNQCLSMTTAPKLPNNVTDMQYTFYNCNALKTYEGNKNADGDFSNYIIPDTVTNMNATFNRCSSITKSPKIPSNVTNVNSLFYECINLEVAPILPNNIETLNYTFYNCKKLMTFENSNSADGDFTLYKMPTNLTNIDDAFENCESMKKPPQIPNNVTSMRYAFKGCSSLVSVPEIPYGVIDMFSSFSNCTAIQTLPEKIPSTVTEMTAAFATTELSGTIQVPCCADVGFYISITSSLKYVFYHVPNCDGTCGN